MTGGSSGNGAENDNFGYDDDSASVIRLRGSLYNGMVLYLRQARRRAPPKPSKAAPPKPPLQSPSKAAPPKPSAARRLWTHAPRFTRATPPLEVRGAARERAAGIAIRFLWEWMACRSAIIWRLSASCRSRTSRSKACCPTRSTPILGSPECVVHHSLTCVHLLRGRAGLIDYNIDCFKAALQKVISVKKVRHDVEAASSPPV